MKKIVAFGNPLLDTIVSLKDDILLQKYDLKKDGQKEVSLEEMKLMKVDIKSYEQFVTSGGCAHNTLKILQWLSQKQFSATIFGAVGDDCEGKLLKEILKNHGVDANYTTHKSQSTGSSLALVNGSNRSLIAHLGAAEMFSLDHIKNTSLIFEIQNCDLVYMEGFFLSKRVEVASYILDCCNLYKKMFAFNLSGEYLCNEYPDAIRHFVDKSSIIFGNRKEFEVLCRLMGISSVENLVETLGKQGKIVAVTNGQSCVLWIGGGQKCSETDVPFICSEEIVDTTGAGDSFVAGFLAGYLLDKSLKSCVEWGCYAAHEIIKRSGCAVPEYLPSL